MALFTTSQDCDIASIAHVKIENLFTADTDPDNPSPSKKIKFDPFDNSKPICIGMLESAQMSSDAADILTDQVSTLSAALSYETTIDDNSSAIIAQGGQRALDILAAVSVEVREGILKDPVKQALSQLDEVTESVSFPTFETTINTVLEKEQNLPAWSCDNNNTCVRSNITATSFKTLYSCAQRCIPPEDPDAFKTKRGLREAKQTSQISYDLCGNFYRQIAPYLASTCKTSNQGVCDLDKIFGNLSDTCSNLNTAGILMYVGFAFSYIMLFGVLGDTYSVQTSKRWAVALLVIYIIIFLIFGSSFVLYTLTLYGTGSDNYFWQPLRKGLEEGFGDPIDRYWGTFDKVTIQPDTGYIYLIWILVMNAAVITIIAVSLANTTSIFGLYKKVGGVAAANNKGVKRETNKMKF